MYESDCWGVKEIKKTACNWDAIVEIDVHATHRESTRMDRIRNEYIRGSLKVAPVTEKLRRNRNVLACYA